MDPKTNQNLLYNKHGISNHWTKNGPGKNVTIGQPFGKRGREGGQETIEILEENRGEFFYNL